MDKIYCVIIIVGAFIMLIGGCIQLYTKMNEKTEVDKCYLVPFYKEEGGVFKTLYTYQKIEIACDGTDDEDYKDYAPNMIKIFTTERE